MKMKALVGMARTPGATNPGDTFECDDAEAARLLRAGFAECTNDADTKKLASAVKKLDAADAKAAEEAAIAAKATSGVETAEAKANVAGSDG